MASEWYGNYPLPLPCPSFLVFLLFFFALLFAKGGRGRVCKGKEQNKTDVWPPFFFLVYPNGEVCISILHAPGEDPMQYEQASERWSPIQSVEKILISVMSMLAEPNDESPANVDAARMWREKRGEYESIVRANVRKSLGL